MKSNYDPAAAMAATANRRKAQGLCYKCGKPQDDGHKACSACRAKIQTYMRGYRQDHPDKFNYAKEIPVVKPKKPKRKKQRFTLDELAKIAHERGISYGELVVQMETGRLVELAPEA